jgi:carbamate kinase
MCRSGTRELVGVEAVIDKDRSSAVLAHDVGADSLVIVTDAPGVFVDWGTPRQRQIVTGHPDAVEALSFAAGSMGPKVEAACSFARRSGRVAAIGALEDLPAILDGRAGTRIATRYTGITYS